MIVLLVGGQQLNSVNDNSTPSRKKIDDRIRIDKIRTNIHRRDDIFDDRYSEVLAIDLSVLFIYFLCTAVKGKFSMYLCVNLEKVSN